MKPTVEGFFKGKRKRIRVRGQKKIHTCSQCGLFTKCHSPKMEMHGEGKKEILLILETGGRVEDRRGEQLTGDAGKKLEGVLRKFGINMNRDCYKQNAVRCRTSDENGRNRTPTDKEIEYCRPLLFKDIQRVKPKKIILLGEAAIKSVIGNRVTVDGMNKWVGWQIPDQELGCWVFPTYHPSFVYLRDKKNQAAQTVFEQHLKTAIEWNEPFPDNSFLLEGRIITDVDVVNKYLLHIMCQRPKITFDFETTGIKPHREGHKILCMSMATDEEAVGFPFFSDNPTFMEYLEKILTDNKVKKSNQNITKYEDMWAREVFGKKLEGIYGDPMLGSHFLRSTKGITGLKRQAYLQFGIANYEVGVKPYMKALSKEEEKEHGNNSYNRLSELWELEPEKMLKYCMIDSKISHHLYYKVQLPQIAEMAMNGYTGYNLLLEGAKALCDVEQTGLHIDVQHYKEQHAILFGRMNSLKKKLKMTKEAEIWKKQMGKELNPQSNDQIIKLVYDILKIDTGMEKRTVNHEVLEDMDTPFSNQLLLFKKLKGIKDKIEDILREQVNGVLHPSFGLHVNVTYRSESQNPNFQNVQKRDALAKRIVRKGIKPSEGNVLGELDYEGIEVAIGCAHHNDPEMIKNVTDPSTDMHRDSAAMLLKLPHKEITDSLRYLGKNNWVFPQFYGSYYEQCAKNLWKNIQDEYTAKDILVIDHLKEKGIKNYKQFVNHVKSVEDWFWGIKFKVYDEWKTKIWEQYQKTGYIDLKSGFRIAGLFKKNDVTNYAIQGSAAHCLIWALIKLNNLFRINNMKTKIIGQVHDSILVDMLPSELKEVKKMAAKVMCTDTRKQFKWINIPLKVKMEVSAINGNWFEMKDEFTLS